MVPVILEVECFRKSPNNLALDGVGRRWSFAFGSEGSHCHPLQATGYDGVERGKIRSDIEGKTVPGDPAAHPHPDRGDFTFINPHPGTSGVPFAAQAKGRQSLNQTLLQQPQVAVQVAVNPVKMNDRIADQLPRAVPGDIPAARSLESGDAAPVQLLCREVYMRVIAAAPDGDNRVVFEQHQVFLV